jgi:hypothetical protein
MCSTKPYIFLKVERKTYILMIISTWHWKEFEIKTKYFELVLEPQKYIIG